MKVIDAARTIGLTPNDDMSGTIDELKVLDVLRQLGEADPANADLFTATAQRVQRSRSAGAETIDPKLTLSPGAAASVQLRYRSEMGELFTDLAIDVGMRQMALDSRA